MASSLDNIRYFLKKDLDQFESYFKESMKSDVPLLDKITHYIVKSKGKQVRPMFVFLTAKIFGEINKDSYVGASMIELLHTATLVHDDVVDDAMERRGFFSINALWKNKIAVLVGDYLLSRGLLAAINNNRFEMLKILSDAVNAMIEGELIQIEKARRLDINEQVYYDIINKKTASLIRSACGVGVASVSDDQSLIDEVMSMGETIGLCFQIKDDLFDYGTSNIGKPLGIDIKERKMTLPLIYALSQADSSTKKDIIKSIKNNSTDSNVVSNVIQFVHDHRGIEYATDKMYEYRSKAFDFLKEFPQNQANEYLKELIIFTTERKK